MSLIGAIGPYLTVASQMAGAGLGANAQAADILRQRKLEEDQRNQQNLLQRFQMQHQAEQDRLRQVMENRQAQHGELMAQIAAMQHLTPLGRVSRENVSTAIPLPAKVAPSAASQPEEADIIPGAAQRKSELDTQATTPNIEVGGQAYGAPTPKAPAYNKDQAITKRTQELVGQGKSPEEAAKQARLEHGELNPPPPANPVTVNAGQPYTDPKTGKLYFPKTDKQGNLSWVEGQPGLTKLPPAGSAGQNALTDRMVAALNMQEEGLGQVTSLAQRGAIRPSRITLAFRHPDLQNAANWAHIPGFDLNADEQQAIPAIRNFLTGVYHYETPRGGEPKDKDLETLARRYFGTLGDTPAAMQQKFQQLNQDVIDRRAQMQSRHGVITPGASSTPVPNPSPNPKPSGGAKESKLTVQTQDEYDHLRSLGLSKSDIQARYTIAPGIAAHD